MILLYNGLVIMIIQSEDIEGGIMRSKFHNEYMQILGECIARYPREIDPISFINQYGFSRVKSFTNWLESNELETNYYPEWFREFLESPDFRNHRAGLGR